MSHFHKSSFRCSLVSVLILPLLMGGLTTLMSAPPAKGHKEDKVDENFTAWAVLSGSIATGKNFNVDFMIKRWTTDAERTELLRTLVERGPDDAFRLLRKQEGTGRIATPARVGETLRYARDFRGGGKRRIVLATDRPIHFREAYRSPRFSDYAITLVELIVDEETGKGGGVLMVGVKIKHDKKKNQLVLEHYDTKPIKLNQVRLLK